MVASAHFGALRRTSAHFGALRRIVPYFAARPQFCTVRMSAACAACLIVAVLRLRTSAAVLVVQISPLILHCLRWHRLDGGIGALRRILPYFAARPQFCTVRLSAACAACPIVAVLRLRTSAAVLVVVGCARAARRLRRTFAFLKDAVHSCD